ncbi:MAG: protein kinase [Planctomycetes bacterium]|nr:protein kinase [Planctomycetota bacterium]
MPKLTVEKGQEKGRSVLIGKSSVLVGRDPAASLRISDTLSSRLHFRLEARLDGYWLVDQESMNGTYVNGERIRERKLAVGDKVQVGETLFSFLADEGESKQGEMLAPLRKRGYRVESRLGRGGMGTVYKAVQVSLNRIVALKILSPELVRDRNFISLFIQEARACASLNHPNIVQVYDVGKEEDIYFFSMEFLPGGSVQDILAKEKRLSVPRVIDVIHDAARGLEYAERKQLVHRDIKPDNLMIGEDGIIKIGDLGLAMSLKDRAKDDSGVIFGTPHFIAPEQFLGKPVDHRADIYALGASLYRMLSGTTPYTGNNVREILLRKVREEPPPLAGAAPGLPPRLIQICERMMQKDPEQRYQSATQLLADLEVFKLEQKGTAAGSGPAAALGAPPPAAATAATLPGSGPSTALPVPSVSVPEMTRIAARSPWAGVAALGILAAALAGGTFFVLSKIFKRPPLPTPNPVDVVDQNYDLLAKALLRGALEAERLLDPEDDEAYGEVLNKYQEVLDKTPKAPEAAQAAERMKRLAEGLVKVRDSRASRSREEEGKSALEAARAFRNAEWKKAGNFPEAVAVDACIAKLRELIAAHPDTEASKTAAAEIAGLEKFRADAEGARTALADVLRKVPELVGRADYSAAWSELEAAQREPRLGPFAPRLAALREELRQACVRAVEEALRKAEAEAGAGRLEEAIAALETFKSGKLAPDMIPPLTRYLGELKVTLDRARTLAQEAKDRKEKEGFNEALGLILVAASQRDYARVEKAFQLLDSGLASPALKARLQTRARDFALERQVFDAFMKRSANGKDRATGLRDASISLENNLAATIKVAKPTGITFKLLEGGRAEIERRWEDIEPGMLLPYLRRAWSQSGNEHLGIGMLALRLGLLADADAEFKAARNDPAVTDAAQACLGRIKDVGGLFDEDAHLLFDAGRQMYGQGRFREAVSVLERLEKDYESSPAWADIADEARQYLKEARNRAK